MKKLIAMLACLTLALTMFAGLTVSAAADYGTPTFKLVPVTNDDGSLYEEDGCYVVDVVYEGFENFVPFNGNSRKPAATGIMGLEIYWSNDNEDAYVYDGAVEGVGVGGSIEVATISATKVADIVTDESGVICSAYYLIEDAEAVANLKIDSVVVNVRSYENGAAVEAGKVDLGSADVNFVGCTLGKTAPAPVDTAVTFDTKGVKGFVADAVTTAVNGEVTIKVTPAFGSKIASVETTDGTVDTSYNAAGGTIKITGLTAETATVTIKTAEDDAAGVATFAATYVDGDTAYVFGKVPAASTAFGIKLADKDYAANNKTAEGVFGVAFIGLEAGSYSAAAYADGLEGAAVTFEIAE